MKDCTGAAREKQGEVCATAGLCVCVCVCVCYIAVCFFDQFDELETTHNFEKQFLFIRLCVLREVQ